MSISSDYSYRRIMPLAEQGSVEQEYISRTNKVYLARKLAQAILWRPFVATVALAYRTIKMLTYVPLAGLVTRARTSGNEATGKYLFSEYVKMLKTVRNFACIPLKIKRVIDDIRAESVVFQEGGARMTPKEYLKTEHNVSFHHFSSDHLSSGSNFRVVTPVGIEEMPAYSSPDLDVIMASDFLKGRMMGLSFGSPNVALFTTQGDDPTITKVEAKSLRRADMVYKRDTEGKLQSGVFFIPTNLPEEAIKAIEDAAEKFEGCRHNTCVNTNCRILKAAGFTMDGVDLDDIYMPTTFMENILFRNMYYEKDGKKYKVHFDIVKTTSLSLEEYCEKVDGAVLTTRIRHKRIHQESRETKLARSEKMHEMAAAEKVRLAAQGKLQEEAMSADVPAEQRAVKVSLTSCLGNLAARFWGRHTIYEIDLSDKKEEITDLFRDRVMLSPFPQKKPSWLTRLKKTIFFSARSIKFLRRHMNRRQTSEMMDTKDILRLLTSSEGSRLNYVLLPDRVVIGRVHLGSAEGAHQKAADWALSKHALLADRKLACCAGEVWYDKVEGRFKINGDSGTYLPDDDRVKIVVDLAKQVFQTDRFDVVLEEREEVA